MNIRLFSDLHLEFGPFDPGEGEVLILAGDICVADDIEFQTSAGKSFLEFFDKCARRYDKVFYTFGNHEYYYSDFNKVDGILRAAINPKITILNNQFENYGGINFIGTTLWTDFMGGNGVEMEMAARYMSDYHIIQNGNRKLSPEDILNAHTESVNYITNTVPSLSGPVIIFSHHSPSFKSLEDSNYGIDCASGYASNLENVMKINSKIVTWCHGHIHETKNYTVGNCNVRSNPRGYHPNSLNQEFSETFNLTVGAIPAIIKR